MLTNFINFVVMFSLTACCMQNHLSTQLSHNVSHDVNLRLKSLNVSQNIQNLVNFFKMK